MQGMRPAVPLFAIAPLVACASGAQTDPQTAKSTPASITCPALDGALDFSVAFAIDQRLSTRLTRLVRLVARLEASARALDGDVRASCRTLAADLGQQVFPEATHPCELLRERVRDLKRSFGSGGFALEVRGLQCGVPQARIAACAGECLTGREGVTSTVTCAPVAQGGAPVAGLCGLDFTLPHAAPECAAECAAQAFGELSCSAEVSVRLGNDVVGASAGVNANADVGATSGASGTHAAMAEALRRDLPRLFGIASSIGPRSVALAREVTEVVDELARSIDELSSGADPIERRAVTGAILATCLAPELTAALAESRALTGSIDQALKAQASFTAP